MQTNIQAAGQQVAIPGQISSSGDNDIVSKFSAEASAEIAFGYGLVADLTNAQTAEQGAKLPSGSGDVFVGVNTFGFNHEKGASGDLGDTGVKPKGGLQCFRRGRIFVAVDPTVASIVPQQDRGYLRYSVNALGTVVGTFQNASDAGHTLDLTDKIVFTSQLYSVIDAQGNSTKVAEIEIAATVK